MSEEFTPTARWRQNDDGTWTPTRTSGGGGGGEVDTTDYLVPGDILAGSGITVVDNGDGTLTITATNDAHSVTVYRQDFRPASANEGDYWIRDKPGVDVTPANLLTDPAKWTVVGFGYPPGANISVGPDGMSLVWTTGGADGQQAGFVVPFVDGHVYRTEITVASLTGAADEVRTVWAFTRDSGVLTLAPGADATSIMDVPWNTGQGTFVLVQGRDSSLGGGVIVKGIKVLDVTNDRPEQYVYDAETGWTLLGDGGGGPDEVVIQAADPGTPEAGPYPRLWVDTDDPGSGGGPGYLPVTGGIMTGPLVLNDDPTLALGAATKQYVDDRAIDPALYLPLTGGTLTGQLSVPSLEMRGVQSFGSGLLDLNDAPGGVGFGENFTNAPHDDTAGWYVSTWVGSATYKVQRATQGYIQNPATFERIMTAGTWSPWRHIHGGLPDAVGFTPANTPITATSWATLAGAPTINAPFPMEARVDLSGWLVVPGGASNDLRVGFAASGATVISPTDFGGWGGVLYQASLAAAGSSQQYGSHGVTKEVTLNKGVSGVGIAAYRVGTGAVALNYGRMLLTPSKFRDG